LRLSEYPNNVDGMSGAIVLQGQDGWPLLEGRVVLKCDRSSETVDRIAKQNTISGQFAKPMPRNLHFAAERER